MGNGPVEAPPRRRTPGVLLQRLSGTLNALMVRGVVRRVGDGLFDLLLDAQEAAQGGMISISMRVPVHCRCQADSSCKICGGKDSVDELFSAWLAVPPDIADGTILLPSELLRRLVKPVRFRAIVRHRVQASTSGGPVP